LSFPKDNERSRRKSSEFYFSTTIKKMAFRGFERGDYWTGRDLPRLFDQHFGLALSDDDILPSIRPHAFSSTLRPRRLFSRQQSGVSDIKVEKDAFKVMLDVQQFTPKELNVKTVDGFIVVEGKHDEREDEHGYISRQFTRRYPLPADIKPENVECNLSSDGVLLIAAARIVEEPRENERAVPIKQTYAPAINKNKPEQSATTASSTTDKPSEKSTSEGRRIEVTLTE